MTRNRLTTTVTCKTCDNRTSTKIDPTDAEGSIGFWCPECGAVTSHRTSGVRLA